MLRRSASGSASIERDSGLHTVVEDDLCECESNQNRERRDAHLSIVAAVDEFSCRMSASAERRGAKHTGLKDLLVLGGASAVGELIPCLVGALLVLHWGQRRPMKAKERAHQLEKALGEVVVIAGEDDDLFKFSSMGL